MSRLTRIAAVALALGCAPPAPPPDAAVPVPRPDDATAFAAAHDALAAAGSGPLRWTLTPYYGADAIAARYGPVATLAGADLDWPVEVTVADDYQAALLAVVRGQSDVALLSPYAVVQALKIEPRLQVFASIISEGRTTYSGYLLTAVDSPVRSIADLRGQPVGFVSRHSTSGWLYPAAALLDAGLDPLHDVQPRFYGDHARVLDALLAGEVAAAATWSDMLQGQLSRPEVLAGTRVLARTGRIPSDAWVARADLPPAVVRGLSAALARTNTTTAAGRARMAQLPGLSGFFPVTEDHYAPVQAVEQKVLSALGDQPLPPEEPPPAAADPAAADPAAAPTEASP